LILHKYDEKSSSAKQEEDLMSPEENKALVRRYIEVVWNQKTTAALDELPAPNYQRYVSATSAPLSREGLTYLISSNS
jgi:hypothetical protein